MPSMANAAMTALALLVMLAQPSSALRPACRTSPALRVQRAGVFAVRTRACSTSLSSSPSSSTPDDGSPRRERQSSPERTALLWLSSSRLRLRDNPALTRAAELGPDGLAICVLRPHDVPPSSAPVRRHEITPAEAFGYAALRAFDRSLSQYGQKLWLVPSNGQQQQEDCDASSIMGNIVQNLNPGHVVVDVSLLDKHHDNASKLRGKLQSMAMEDTSNTPEVVEVMDDGLLVSFDEVPKALGRSRKGGRALRWTTFLANTMKPDEKEIDKLGWTASSRTWDMPSLPPPLKNAEGIIPTSPIPDVESFPSWTRRLLSEWGEITEDEAMARADGASRVKNDVESSSPLTERGSKDTKLSPYLRWGVLSPQRAARAGVRTRDLLWRDWSYACYGLLGPILRGDAVLEFMDDARCSLNSLDVDGKDLFPLWCVGNTGSRLVDAGMRQLWVEGWMPRKIRLLAAGCLVEGLGLDWRLGRDWFQHTLVDHDPAINEMMWQNAGLCGVDPFYHGIKWESPPSGMKDEEYVEKWMSKRLVWPTSLKPYSKREPPLQTSDGAESQRQALRAKGVYKAARRVTNSGVRMAWPGLNDPSKSGVEDGEVMGVGLAPVKELRIES